MENLDHHHGAASQERAQLKSLSLGIAGHLSQLLGDQGFGDRAIDIVETLVFAMFIVGDTYVLAKPEKEPALEVIHGFYDDMQHFFIQKTIIQDHQISDPDEIQSVSEQFHRLSRERYEQYREKLQQDIAEMMGLSCPATASSLLDNLFIAPLINAEKLQLMRAVSDKVLSFWTACIQNFK
jgi:hypothetical protein